MSENQSKALRVIERNRRFTFNVVRPALAAAAPAVAPAPKMKAERSLTRREETRLGLKAIARGKREQAKADRAARRAVTADIKGRPTPKNPGGRNEIARVQS